MLVEGHIRWTISRRIAPRGCWSHDTKKNPTRCRALDRRARTVGGLPPSSFPFFPTRFRSIRVFYDEISAEKMFSKQNKTNKTFWVDYDPPQKKKYIYTFPHFRMVYWCVSSGCFPLFNTWGKWLSHRTHLGSRLWDYTIFIRGCKLRYDPLDSWPSIRAACRFDMKKSERVESF